MFWTSTNSVDPPIPDACVEIFLKERPITAVNDDTFAPRRVPLKQAWDTITNGNGKVLVRVLYVSVEPAMRGWLSNRRSYVRPVAINEKMRALGVGVVMDLKGDSGKLKKGMIVSGMFGWSDYCIIDGKSVNRCDLRLMPKGIGATAVLGALGTTGMTAYFGLLNVGKIKHNETVVVSAAAGATGSIAAQIAKHVYNCHVIGIAGGKEKCDYLTNDLGLDAAIDYKSDVTVDAALKKALDGRRVNVFFDNVGGSILESVLRQLDHGARIVICGGISQYNLKIPPPGPRNYLQLIASRASMTGFLLYDYEKQFPTAFRHLSQWFASGKISTREDIVDGLSNAPTALGRLFEGKNIGKVVVRLTDDADELIGRLRPAKL